MKQGQTIFALYFFISSIALFTLKNPIPDNKPESAPIKAAIPISPNIRKLKKIPMIPTMIKIIPIPFILISHPLYFYSFMSYLSYWEYHLSP